MHLYVYIPEVARHGGSHLEDFSKKIMKLWASEQNCLKNPQEKRGEVNKQWGFSEDTQLEQRLEREQGSLQVVTSVGRKQCVQSTRASAFSQDKGWKLKAKWGSKNHLRPSGVFIISVKGHTSGLWDQDRSYLCHSAEQPQFHPQNLHTGRKKSTSESCPVTTTECDLAPQNMLYPLRNTTQ